MKKGPTWLFVREYISRYIYTYFVLYIIYCIYILYIIYICIHILYYIIYIYIYHQDFQVPKNGGTESYKAVLGVGFPLHKPYIQLT